MTSYKKEIALALAATLTGLALGVAMLGAFAGQEGWQDSTIQFDPELGWANKPRHVAVIDGKTYTTNSLGLRAPEISPEREQMLVAGDSVAFGHGVNDAEALPQRLAAFFPQWQVVNMGVNGYGFDQYLLHLERHAARMRPRFIITVICTGNDLGDTMTDVSYGKSKPMFVIDESKTQIRSGQGYTVTPDNLKLTNGAVSRYSCANLTSARLWKGFTLNLEGVRNRYCPPRTVDGPEAQYLSMAILMRLGRLAKQHGAGLLFVLSPSRSDFSSAPPPDTRPGYLRYFQDLFGQMRFRYLDFYAEATQRGWKAEDLFFDELHYSAAGNGKLAAAIAEHIASKSR